MWKADRDVPVEAPNARILAAAAGIHRQLRIQKILLIIVGIEIAIFFGLRLWSAL